MWLYLRDKNIYLAGVHDFMAEFKPDFTDDEIDLRELCAALWRGKWLIFSPLAIVPMVLAVVYQRQTGAAVVVLCGFVALFVGSYLWAVRRARQPVYRRSRKLKSS